MTFAESGRTQGSSIKSANSILRRFAHRLFRPETTKRLLLEKRLIGEIGLIRSDPARKDYIGLPAAQHIVQRLCLRHYEIDDNPWVLPRNLLDNRGQQIPHRLSSAHAQLACEWLSQILDVLEATSQFVEDSQTAVQTGPA